MKEMSSKREREREMREDLRTRGCSAATAHLMAQAHAAGRLADAAKLQFHMAKDPSTAAATMREAERLNLVRDWPSRSCTTAKKKRMRRQAHDAKYTQ